MRLFYEPPKIYKLKLFGFYVWYVCLFKTSGWLGYSESALNGRIIGIT